MKPELSFPLSKPPRHLHKWGEIRYDVDDPTHRAAAKAGHRRWVCVRDKVVCSCGDWVGDQ